MLGSIGRHLEDRASLTEPERGAVVYRLFHEGSRRRAFRKRFVLMMSLSTAIATLGVVADSTAVVIGAMLVAPMMAPILSVSAAMVMGWPRRVLSQAAVVTFGCIVAASLATLIAFVVPWQQQPLPAELVARTSPNLLDLGIALAAGAAGAYAQIQRQSSDALIGVAVAVALVPPLAVVGVTVHLTEWQMALGAFLLFMTNVTGIVLSASVTLLLCGFVPGRRLMTGNRSIASGVRWAALAVILIIFPMQFGRGSVLIPVDPTDEVTAAVETYLSERADRAELVGVEVTVEDDVTRVDLVVAAAADAPGATQIAAVLADQLDTTVEVELQVVEAEIKRATVLDP